MKLNKKNIIIVISLIILMLIILLSIKLYNSYSEKQRDSIKYCEIDSDCVIKIYTDSICGGWSGCFNKNEKPMNSLSFIDALCKPFHYDKCICEKGKCIPSIF